jgi:hypothetical protein
MEKYPRIISVKALEGFELLVGFDNGIEKIYDCRPLLSHDAFLLLKVPAFFRAVRVDGGGYGISWNDDMDLAESELWANGRAVGP